jgi:hypothetical protein
MKTNCNTLFQRIPDLSVVLCIITNFFLISILVTGRKALNILEALFIVNIISPFFFLFYSFVLWLIFNIYYLIYYFLKELTLLHTLIAIFTFTLYICTLFFYIFIVNIIELYLFLNSKYLVI